MKKLPALRPIVAGIRTRPFWSLSAWLAPGLALAGPTGADVVAGQVAISSPDAHGTVVDQASNAAIIHWQQFSLGGQDYVIFNQPSASAAVLNRVVGGLPSEILGSIQSNGRVFLINPQGVMFGAGSRIDVGSLVASTLDIADTDFLSGRYAFAGASGAAVANHGTITGSPGGFVVLQGDAVTNTGLVQAMLGDVVLAAGSATTLTLDGEGLVSFAVDQAALSDRAGVENLGEIVAQGGAVLMTARVAQDLVHAAINQQGRVSAQSIQEQDGVIVLSAQGGDIVQGGTLDVSGAAPGADAGDIRVLADGDVTLTETAQLLADATGTGQIGRAHV